MKTVFHGILLGIAVGDSLGLPAEGLSPERIKERWPGSWRQRLIFSRGMISDDTEHTVWVARSLIENPSDADAFQRRLAWRLRWWLLALPAGVGFATLRSIAKLWIGFPRTRSGVFSAGNGPAMRSAIIGGFFAGDTGQIRNYVRASTRLTHTDPKAEIAALAVALTASWIAQSRDATSSSTDDLMLLWRSAGPDDEAWTACLQTMREALDMKMEVHEFAGKLGLSRGVTGYSYHSVPVALYVWIRHRGDFRMTIEAALDCGGDTDTVGAICGGLAGIESEIPQEWINGIADWPVSTGFLDSLGDALQQRKNGSRPKKPFLFWPAIPLRNILFLLVVIAHGLRRLVPF